MPFSYSVQVTALCWARQQVSGLPLKKGSYQSSQGQVIVMRSLPGALPERLMSVAGLAQPAHCVAAYAARQFQGLSQKHSKQLGGPAQP